MGEAVDFINYVVLSRGVLLTSDRVGFGVGKRQTTISFKLTFAHSPTCQVIAYFVNKVGEFIYGTIDFSVRDKLPNYVS